jgi:hydroxymethylpyrimidine pyrophosphatase-like HAD family hydrolase
MDKSTEALKIHTEIKKLLKKLNELGYEFMFFSGGTSIRSKRNG